MRAEGEVIRFIRTGGGERIFVAVNLSDRAAQIDRPGDCWHQIGAELGGTGPARDGTVALDPWQVCLLVQAKS